VDVIGIAVLDMPIQRKESRWGVPEHRHRVHLPRRRERRNPAMPFTSGLADTPGVLAVSH
jgi:hypothetical protein